MTVIVNIKKVCIVFFKQKDSKIKSKNLFVMTLFIIKNKK